MQRDGQLAAYNLSFSLLTKRRTLQFSVFLPFIRNGNEINYMMTSMTQYHCNKCGMGFDTEEELDRHDYDEDLIG